MEPIAFILTFFISLGIVYSNKDAQFTLPSEETIKQWEKIKIPSSELSIMLSDEICYQDKKHFLACASSLEHIGRDLGVIFLPNEKILLLEDENISQKYILKKWELFYENNFNKGRKVSFKKIFEEKIIKKTNPNIHSLLTVSGINGNYTITKDPHSYLEPIENFSLYKNSIKTIDQPNPMLKDSSQEDFNLDKISDEEYDEDQVVEVLINKNKEEPSLLTIKKFNNTVCDQTKKALKEILNSEVTNLIIDLKGNPGGLVDQAVCVCGLFLGEKKIVKLSYFKNQFPREEIVSKEQKMYVGNLVVFVDESSASAAEIMAGALKYYKRAQLVGKRTFGKGTFQQPTVSKYNKYNLRYMQTNGFYYFPDGKSPQLKGLTPDKEDDYIETSLREDVYYMYPLHPENFD